MKMRVEYTREEVHEVIKKLFIKTYSMPAEGYELTVGGNYGEVNITLTKKGEEKDDE